MSVRYWAGISAAPFDRLGANESGSQPRAGRVAFTAVCAECGKYAGLEVGPRWVADYSRQAV